MTGTVSLGLAGALGPELIAKLAPAVERAGFAALWINEGRRGEALAAAAAAAAVTERLPLGVGVIPVDRTDAAEIIAAARSLPRERLTVGVGSGAVRVGALARVGDAVERLRDAGIGRVVVGALGPRMRRLGAERADGVLLNWVPAPEVGRQAAALHALAPATRVSVYVRTAVDDAARARLAAEAARYAAIPQYAAHFARLGVAASDAALDGAGALRAGLGAYRQAADEVVLRAIVAEDEEAAYLSFLTRAAAAAGLDGVPR